MVDEGIETTKDGRIYVLCWALDQQDSHSLMQNNVTPCVDAVDWPSFKRRYDMVKKFESYSRS